MTRVARPRRKAGAVAAALVVLTACGGPAGTTAGPPGGWIAFVRPTAGADLDSSEIYLTDQTGSKVRRLTHGLAASKPIWSPDGSRIAYLDRGRIMLIEGDGSDPRSILEPFDGNTEFSRPTWSPDGEHLAFSATVFLGDEDRCQELECLRFLRSWIFVVDADGGGLYRITLGEVSDGYPAWSPDGATVAFVRVAVPADHEAYPKPPQIWGATPDGEEVQVLASIGEIGASDLAWSPDASTLAFTTTGSDIALLNVASGQVRTLVRSRVSLRNPFETGSPAWSPDSNRLAFSRSHEDGTDLYVVSAEGGRPRKLTAGADPAWQPTG
jgi:Tol biopolymer transport system component